MQDARPVPKVVDFGVAKAIGQGLLGEATATHVGQMVGTPLYMSPEQAEGRGRGVDTRSDIYSLGVMLYELLTGTTPLEKDRFREAGYEKVYAAICNEDPPRPSSRISTLDAARASTICKSENRPARLPQQLRGDLDWIVMKALEKDPERRVCHGAGVGRRCTAVLGQPAHPRPGVLLVGRGLEVVSPSPGVCFVFSAFLAGALIMPEPPVGC